MSKRIESKLIVGCGYLGGRVAERWLAAGHEVHALTRSPDRAIELEGGGVRAIVGDVADPVTLKPLGEFDSVLFAVGYDRRNSAAPIEQVYAGGVHNLLAALPAKTRRFIYISSTGVYGDAGGDVVDEQTPPSPLRAGGKASLAAEHTLAAHPLGRRAVVMRSAGIYGPNRIPYLQQLRAGEPIAAPSDGWLNLIHGDDAASAVLAAESWLDQTAAETGPHTFCVSDGRPVIRGDYYREVARLLGAPEPTFTTPPADSPAAARAAANKRISNAKLVAELGATLTYPDYRAGLAAILSDA
ncbi:MAG: SDR family oxidoreductase [Planctomycetales bacterium]|nr:SDR family oxidoreductase [Planctomycetales bacterium]